MTVVPVPVRVPTAALPPAMLSTTQVTAGLVVPVMVAVKERVAALPKVVAPGLRDSWSGAWTLTMEDALLLASAMLVALMVWLPTVVGAV